jgi:hypothetical protein
MRHLAASEMPLSHSAAFQLKRQNAASTEEFPMNLREYFEQANGVGVLATADAAGIVNAAIYSKPYFLDETDEMTIAFIMGDRNSHDNVRANPNAVYLFIENADDYLGKRLTLTKIKEEDDQEKIRTICRRKLSADEEQDTRRFLVHFRIEAIRPLLGTGA